MENILEVRNLSVSFESPKGEVQAVRDVSFSLKKGEVLAIVGESGCGKSVLCKSIMKLLPKSARIKEGTILLKGTDITRYKERDMQKIRGKFFSMIFQDPMTSLNPTMKIGQQIAEAILIHDRRKTKEQVYQKVIQLMELVGIEHARERYHSYPYNFSGGMRQRCVMAIALASDPEILFADEPTTALDVTIQAQVLDIIKNLQKELNTAMIMITHDLGIVAEVCDNVAVVYAGEIVEYGSKEEIFDHPTHPYTIGLFGSLPDIHSDVKRLSPIAGMPPDPSNLPSGCAFSPRCPYASEECKKAAVDLTGLGGTHVCRCIKAAKPVQSKA